MTSPKQLVIIAGGKGTRLKALTGNRPKPMVEIGGKPLLEHQIKLSRLHGFHDVVVLTGYGASHIEDFLGDGSQWGVQVRYAHETEPLGTAGAVLNARPLLNERFLVMYGDTMLNIDLDRLWNAHQAEDDATIVVHPNDHPHDSDLVEADETGRVVAFHPYPHPAGHYFANLVNAALYVVNRNSLKEFTVRKPLDFGKHVFPELLASGGHIRAYRTREYIKDCGTPERVAKVERDYDSGRINRSSLRNALPAIFLDRDGTLNRENGYVTSPDQLHILAGAAEAVRLINGSGRLAVVITNQPVIARGDCTEAQLRLVHNKLEWILGEQHAYLDGIYFCPHHPEAGFEGERSELKIACDCRKPGTALLSGAVADLNIDVRQSWMIGDRAGDVQAAAAFGIRSAWVKSGAHTEVPEGCEPDCVFDNVLDAVTEILATP